MNVTARQVNDVQILARLSYEFFSTHLQDMAHDVEDWEMAESEKKIYTAACKVMGIEPNLDQFLSNAQADNNEYLPQDIDQTYMSNLVRLREAGYQVYEMDEIIAVRQIDGDQRTIIRGAANDKMLVVAKALGRIKVIQEAESNRKVS